jgi:hypothetical protein
VLLDIARLAVETEDVLPLNIDVPEQKIVHMVGKALRVGCFKAHVFVEVESCDGGEVDSPLIVKSDELLIEPEWRLSSGETQNRAALVPARFLDDRGGFRTNAVIIVFDDDFHGLVLSSDAVLR